MPELVARDDRHDGEAEGESEHDALPERERALGTGQALKVDGVERSDMECGRDRKEKRNERERRATTIAQRKPDEKLFQASRPVSSSVPPH